MRQKIRFFLAFILLGGGFFILASCKNLAEPSFDSFAQKRVFWAYNLKMNRVDSCPSSLLATGNSCLVYGEDALNIPKTFANQVANEFDTKIYSVITGAFGIPSDMDNNRRVIILLLNIQEDQLPGGAYTAGYFNSNDLFFYNYSNRGEMLYINYKNLESNNLYPTMAHELQHLINRSNHLNQEMDLWIDEGLASAAEYLYGGQQNDRIACFNDDTQETIQKGNNFFIWNGYWEGKLSEKPPETDVLANYATAYLFFQWLRIHADNDSGIYKDIIKSPYTDYRAVTKAAWENIPDFRDIVNNNAEDWENEDWANRAWADLLGAWYAANRLKAGSGIYGYEDEINLSFTWSWPGSHSVSLYPGEGVYSQITGNDNRSPSKGTPAIRYLGLDSSGAPDESPPYDTTYLLTYNGSVTVIDNNGKDASAKTEGYAADIVPVPASMVRAMAASSGEAAESPEAILRRWDGGRVFLEKLQESGTFPQN